METNIPIKSHNQQQMQEKVFTMTFILEKNLEKYEKKLSIQNHIKNDLVKKSRKLTNLITNAQITL